MSGEWIPVAERLPVMKDEHGCTPNVLGYYPGTEDIQLLWYTGHHWESGDGSGDEMQPPSHWMPLPAPPSDGK